MQLPGHTGVPRPMSSIAQGLMRGLGGNDWMKNHLQALGTALPYLSRILLEELWDDWGLDAHQLLVLGALMWDHVMSLLLSGLCLTAACCANISAGYLHAGKMGTQTMLEGLPASCGLLQHVLQAKSEDSRLENPSFSRILHLDQKAIQALSVGSHLAAIWPALA